MNTVRLNGETQQADPRKAKTSDPVVTGRAEPRKATRQNRTVSNGSPSTAETDEAISPPDELSRGGSQRLKARIVMGLTVFVALAVGFGAGVWLALPKTPSENSAEAGFARDMSTHHAQAVSMAMLEYRNGADDQLRQIAYDIATTQQAQIGIMDAWLSKWGLSATGDKPPMSWMRGSHGLMKDGLMAGMATNAEMKRLRELSGRNLDILFSQLMINHHIGGIHMAEAALDQANDDEVLDLAKQMKNGQQYEIDVLQQKLTSFGVQA